MNHNDRSIRQMIDEPTLADLVNDDPLGLLDRFPIQEPMTASRSGKWEPKKKIGENSKPIGKKHYRKSISHLRVLNDNAIDTKHYGKPISHLRGLAHVPIDDSDAFGEQIRDALTD
jgi:hypothetical protein